MTARSDFEAELYINVERRITNADFRVGKDEIFRSIETIGKIAYY